MTVMIPACRHIYQIDKSLSGLFIHLNLIKSHTIYHSHGLNGLYIIFVLSP